ncbi:hypothetical protein AGRA3207_004517 [Actinomadura graeca]|uniref:NlpC/P60 domain-containing protein n=1 Tax=Actinomadura graeca TaxID=2750812 RepID=A0ABX8QXM4_9ACTN|nr:NlpC/P60 family protein [Actinomadura graeca]QXJ23373.1 hypothetical protein AGRA3207_004517 [Actinomadura graeca]
MQGNHDNKRGPLGRRTIGALVLLAGIGVAAATAQASVMSDPDSGKSVAAVETVPPKRTSDRTRADSPHRTAVPHKAVPKKADAPDKKKAAAKKSDDSRRKRKTAPADTDARSAVIARAKTWNPHSGDRVPYSQTRYHDGYRTDCSGFVSMALGLSAPGLNTVGLTSSRYTERITMSELKKGDLVMDALGTNTTRHVVIFEKWANKAHTAYWAYEQRGRYGTDYRTRDYGLSSGSEYKAYRPTNL